MLNRRFFVAISVCVAGSLAVTGQATVGQGSSVQEYLFHYPGPVSGNGQLIAYDAGGSSLSPITRVGTSGPLDLERVIAKPDGSKFYFVGAAGTASLESADSTFTNFQTITLAGDLNATAITPDGKYLLVVLKDQDGASSLSILDTTTDQVIGSPIALSGTSSFIGNLGALCSECWIAVSHNAQTAYVLTNLPGGGSQITPIDLTTRRAGTPAPLPYGDSTSISLSPTEQLYVTAGNALTQLDAKNLTVAASTLLFFTPGQLRYTPDGATAYAVNKISSSGGSLIRIDLASLNTTTWSPANAPQGFQFDDVLVAGNDRIFAYTSVGAALYDVTSQPFSAKPSTIGSAVANGQVNGQGISAAAVTNELPAARYLYLLVTNGTQPFLERIDLATNTADLTNASPGLAGGIMQVVTIPSQGPAAAFLKYNPTQTVNSGATSAPLIARALDASGLPVTNASASFTTETSSGLVINTPSSTTLADGYAETTVTNPTGGAACPSLTCTVTLTVGSATTTFTINVPTSGTGGGNTGGGNTGGGNGGGTVASQVTIVSGDGQLVQAATTTAEPMTVKVTDENGNPLADVPVTFTVTAGSGTVDACDTVTGQCVTDANGLAGTKFEASQLVQNVAFTSNTIKAATQYGSVNFTVVAFGSVPPLAIPIVPDLGATVQVTQGAVSQDAIQVQFQSSSGPVPGVGISILNAYDPTQPAPAKCQGSTLSDANGVAHCNVVATCAVNAGTYPINIDVGGEFRLLPASINIAPGGSSQISIVSGNNQSGAPGQKVQALTAKVTNACGVAASGITVNWSVSPASAATLSATTSTTDSNGQASVVATLGQTTGSFQVTASIEGSKVVYQLSNTVPVTGISIASGNNQQAPVSQGFAQPVVVQVTPATAGVQVSFTATGGATLSSATATTGANGQASVNVTAGSSAGPIVITATALTFSATANLTVIPPGPSITAASFKNADSGDSGMVPCGRVTVSGTGVAPNVQGALSGIAPLSALPYTLGGLSLKVNGLPAPVESISNQNGVQQATFETPCEVSPGTATVAVTVNGVTSTISGVNVYGAQPGIHTYVGASGKTYGYVIDAETGATITENNLAHRGGTYYMVVTGLGQTNPPVATNVVGTGEPVDVNTQVIVGVADAGVPVVSAQYLQGWNGFYVVKFTIPDDAPAGVDQHLAIATVVNGKLTLVGTAFGQTIYLPGVQ